MKVISRLHRFVKGDKVNSQIFAWVRLRLDTEGA